MSDVSARVLRTFVDISRASNVAPDAFLQGRMTEAQLLDNCLRVPWTDFVHMLRGLCAALGGLEAMEKAGELAPKLSADLRACATLFETPLEFLKFNVSNWVPAHVPVLSFELSEVAVRKAVVTMKVAPAHEDSPEYARFLTGNFRSAPAHLFDLAPAKVQPKYAPHCMRWDVELPALTPSTPRLRKGRAPVDGELADTLCRALQELATAARALSQQAAAYAHHRRRLEGVAQLGDALCSTADRAQRASMIAAALCSFGGCARVELVHADGTTTSAGEAPAEAKRLSRELKIGDRHVGELRMWVSDHEEDLTLVIERMRPWAAMAITSGVALKGFEPEGDGFPRKFERAGALWDLTDRQRQVLALLVRGKSNKEIASELQCAERTVEIHVTHLLRKSGAVSRAMVTARFWMQL